MSGHDNEGLIDYEDNVHNVATSTVNGTTTSANDVDGKDKKKRGGDDNASEDLINYYEDDSRIHIPNIVDGKDKKRGLWHSFNWLQVIFTFAYHVGFSFLFLFFCRDFYLKPELLRVLGFEHPSAEGRIFPLAFPNLW